MLVERLWVRITKWLNVLDSMNKKTPGLGKIVFSRWMQIDSDEKNTMTAEPTLRSTSWC